MNEINMTATEAREWAKRITAECSDCFKSVKARKFLGRWGIDIDGGSGACYGRTVRSVEAAEDTIRIFKNDEAVAA
jgi:hypothetical protein